jgi:hypothetical protein
MSTSAILVTCPGLPVEQAIQTAKLRDRVSNHCSDVGFLSDVHGEIAGACAEAFRERFTFISTTSGNHYLCPFLDEQLSRTGTDAARSTGNDPDFPSSAAMIRLRFWRATGGGMLKFTNNTH